MSRLAFAVLLLTTLGGGCNRPSADVSRSVTLPTDEPPLPPGPGREAFLANCQMCHSTRYVMNQPRFPRKTWAAEVEKMRVTYGGPIAPERTSEIVDYLVSVNGTP